MAKNNNAFQQAINAAKAIGGALLPGVIPPSSNKLNDVTKNKTKQNTTSGSNNSTSVNNISTPNNISVEDDNQQNNNDVNSSRPNIASEIDPNLAKAVYNQSSVDDDDSSLFFNSLASAVRQDTNSKQKESSKDKNDTGLTAINTPFGEMYWPDKSPSTRPSSRTTNAQQVIESELARTPEAYGEAGEREVLRQEELSKEKEDTTNRQLEASQINQDSELLQDTPYENIDEMISDYDLLNATATDQDFVDWLDTLSGYETLINVEKDPYFQIIQDAPEGYYDDFKIDKVGEAEAVTNYDEWFNTQVDNDLLAFSDDYQNYDYGAGLADAYTDYAVNNLVDGDFSQADVNAWKYNTLAQSLLGQSNEGLYGSPSDMAFALRDILRGQVTGEEVFPGVEGFDLDYRGKWKGADKGIGSEEAEALLTELGLEGATYSDLNSLVRSNYDGYNLYDIIAAALNEEASKDNALRERADAAIRGAVEKGGSR